MQLQFPVHFDNKDVTKKCKKKKVEIVAADGTSNIEIV